MTSAIQAVIYDLDDTLYDFNSSHPVATDLLGEKAHEMLGVDKELFLKVYAEAYDALGHVLDKEKYIGNCHSRTLRLQYALETLGLPLFPAVLTLYDVYWDFILNHAKREPHIEETMQKLKERGIRIGIGTNMTAKMQYRKLERLGLAKYIDFMVTSEESVFDKPDPAFFALAEKKAKCSKEQSLFIGDNLKFDALGASDYGMKGIWYDSKKKWTTETGIAEESVIHDHLEILERYF